jgi:hypothetical protein
MKCGFCILQEPNGKKWLDGVTTINYVPVCEAHKMKFEEIAFSLGIKSWRSMVKTYLFHKIPSGQLNIHRLEAGATPVCDISTPLSSLVACEYPSGHASGYVEGGEDEKCVFCNETHDEHWGVE